MEAKEPGPATPTCTPPSTASPAWPTPRPSMDEKASTTIGFFCRARASMASPGSCGSSPTTGRTTAPRASSRTSRPWPHAIRGSAPTPHGTMARSSATTASWPRSASTPAPTPHSSSATTPSQPPPVGPRCAARSDSPSHRAHWPGPRRPAGRPRGGPGMWRRDRGRCAHPQRRRWPRRAGLSTWDDFETAFRMWSRPVTL